jgi:CheY-like chemotaxis protein
MSLLILVVDDEPDVEALFRQHFRRDLRAGRFNIEFAQSGTVALQHISDAAGISLMRRLSVRR